MPSKQKEAYQIGPDGRLYFHFALGAVYKLYPRFGKPFYYLITEVEFDADTETEYYRIQSAGKDLLTRFSVAQLNDMLNLLPCELVDKGELVELPLLIDEVQAFYIAQSKEKSKANAAYNKALKETAYFKNLTALGILKKSLCLYRSSGDRDKIDSYEKKVAELEAEQEKILTANNVDVRILRKVPNCELCRDSGIVDGQICACAHAVAEQIKIYNAEIRLHSLLAS